MGAMDWTAVFGSMVDLVLTGVFSILAVEVTLGESTGKARRMRKWLLVLLFTEIVFFFLTVGVNYADAYVARVMPDIYKNQNIATAVWAMILIVYNMAYYLANTILAFVGAIWIYRQPKPIKTFTSVLAGLGINIIYAYIYKLVEMPFLKSVPGASYKAEPSFWITTILLTLCLMLGYLFYKKKLLQPLKNIMDTPDAHISRFVRVPILSNLVFALLLSSMSTFGINSRVIYWSSLFPFILIFGCLIGVYVMMYWAIFKSITLSTVLMKRQAELSVAANIQASMLPCTFPAFPQRKEFDIYATMTPAKEVGGDFYDFFLVDNDHLAIVIADVSGKGIPAALFMVITKALLKDNMQSGTDPAQVFTKVNQQLCESNDEEMFVTAWMGVLEISSGHMVYVNAGHNPPLFYQKNGSWEYIKQRSGFVLAGMENMAYKSGELQMNSGDAIYLYTDGVTEATNMKETLYGEAQLKQILDKTRYDTPKQLLESVKGNVDTFVGNASQFDDITMLVLMMNERRD